MEIKRKGREGNLKLNKKRRKKSNMVLRTGEVHNFAKIFINLISYP